MNANAKTKVVVLTGRYRITGNIDLLPGSRVTDFLAQAREFIAVTEADIWDLLEGRRLASCSFLNINRAHIELIMPEEAVTQGIWRPAV